MPRDSPSIHDEILLGSDIAPELASKLLEIPAAWIIAEGRRGRLERIDWQGQQYARKIYHATSPAPFHPFLPLLPGIFRWGRARRSWQSMTDGPPRQLPIPKPLVMVEKPHCAILISSWITGEPIHHWHARVIQNRWPLSDQFRFARWLGKELHRTFSSGLLTRDLAPHNVLIDGPIEGPWQLGIVDLDDSRVGSPPTRQQIIHSLAQIGHLPPTIDRTLKWRTIEAFLDAGGTSLVGDRKKAIKEISIGIDRFAQEKIRRLLQKGKTDPRAGWGLDSAGIPVPFVGGRKGP